MTGADSLGTTGVKAARLIARKANSNRAEQLHCPNCITPGNFRKDQGKSTHCVRCVIELSMLSRIAISTSDGYRADDGAGLRFGADLHHFRFTGPKGVQARLLREQILLRDFNEENSSGFSPFAKSVAGSEFNAAPLPH